MKAAIAAVLALTACLTSASAADAPAIADLAWLTGTWVTEDESRKVEETWLAPDHDTMAGVGRTVTKEGKVSIEFFKLTAEPAGITFTALVGKQPPTPFVLIPGEPGTLVFENKAHDFPQRVFYASCGEDLCARIEGTMDGQQVSDDWRFTRKP